MKVQADKPIALSKDELAARSRALPEGSTPIGGVYLSKRDSMTFHAGDCVIVIYADDNHGIHRCQVCGSGTDYEIYDDEIVGSW
jgi:hypothetical protein